VLLAFGAVPLSMSILAGYRISRSLLLEQSKSGMQELADQQAIQVATELRREQLLLRTIADQLRIAGYLNTDPPRIPASPILEALPEIGAFDGLRLVSADGKVVSQIGLRSDSPQWSPHVPATDWSESRVAVHRSDAGEFIAYLLAVPVGALGSDLWLEGHVNADDARDLFAMPAHTMGGAETAILDSGGALNLVGHPHQADDHLESWHQVPAGFAFTQSSIVDIDGELHLRVQSNVEEISWRVVSVLPLELALEPLSRVRNMAVFGAIGLVLLILATAWLAARSISMPLRKLADAAVSFGRGESYVPLKRTARDEIGLLAGAFSQMSNDLADSSAQIEALHHREMERAEQLASIGEMSSAIAHEIRNPLAGVLYAVELAGRRITSEEDREMLGEAEAQLRRLDQTASQLLRYARPPEPKRAVVDARLLVDRAVKVASYQANAAGIDIESNTGSSMLPVSVDPDLLVQVLVNLILNGIQATARGGVILIATARIGAQIEFHVTDEGAGVSTADAAQIFRPFFTTKHLGTGLGLAISRQITERHGGTLELRSSEGRGALFVVVLPVSSHGGQS